jgi:putative SOS response-associated peptidase YedK
MGARNPNAAMLSAIWRIKRSTHVLLDRDFGVQAKLSRVGGDLRIGRTAAEWVRTFAVLTTPANELVARIHDRMPAILRPSGPALGRQTPLFGPIGRDLK